MVSHLEETTIHRKRGDLLISIQWMLSSETAGIHHEHC